MTDETNTLPPEPAADPTPDQRVLTPAEDAAYTARLAAVGFTYTAALVPEPVGFDVRATDGSVSYGYRFDANAQTAVELMDRICAERGA